MKVKVVVGSGTGDDEGVRAKEGTKQAGNHAAFNANKETSHFQTQLLSSFFVHNTSWIAAYKLKKGTYPERRMPRRAVI